MDYARIYNQLIERSRTRLTTTQFSEWHHVQPTSMGGTDTTRNLALLTVREHFVAHLLLVKMGHTNQAFAVEAFLVTTLPARKAEPKIRTKKWIRKAIARARAAAQREKNRAWLLGEL